MKKLGLTLILINILLLLTGCNNDKSKFEVKSEMNSTSKKNEKKVLYHPENSSINLPKNNEKSINYIIPDSDTNKITVQLLDKLSKEEIEFARNEIYARHGYIFKSKKYRDYFRKQDWYKSNSDFSEKEFSKIENENLKIIGNYINSIEKFTTLVDNNYVKYDLNSDETVDEVSVEFTNDGTTYELIIGHFKDIQANGINFTKMILYDIDSNDEFKEIAIVDEVENKTHFHYFNGKEIIRMGTIPGTENSIKVNGSGKILVEKKGELIDSDNWYYRIQYELTEERALVKLKSLDEKNNYYEMNCKVITKQDFPIYANPSHEDSLTILKKGTIIKIVGTDDIEWCKIESENALKGWINLKLEEIDKDDKSDIDDTKNVHKVDQKTKEVAIDQKQRNIPATKNFTTEFFDILK